MWEIDYKQISGLIHGTYPVGPLHLSFSTNMLTSFGCNGQDCSRAYLKGAVEVAPREETVKRSNDGDVGNTLFLCAQTLTVMIIQDGLQMVQAFSK